MNTETETRTKRWLLVILALLFFGSLTLSHTLMAPSARAGDSQVVIEYNDHIYTKAEVAKLTKQKQDNAKLTRNSATSVAAGYYDWYLIASKNINPPFPYTTIGVLRVWWNSAQQANKARTDHVGNYYGWGTHTGVTICAADVAGNCIRQVVIDIGFYAYYAGDVIIYGMNGICLRAVGSMVANRGDGRTYGATITGHCG